MCLFRNQILPQLFYPERHILIHVAGSNVLGAFDCVPIGSWMNKLISKEVVDSTGRKIGSNSRIEQASSTYTELSSPRFRRARGFYMHKQIVITVNIV